MRKRAFIFALLAAFVLLLNAAAWADVSYNIESMQAAYSKVYNLNYINGYLVKIVINTNVKTYADAEHVQSADTIKWTVENDGVLDYWRLLKLDSNYAYDNNEFLAKPETQEVDVSGLSSNSDTNYKLLLFGNIAKAGTVKLHAEFAGGKDMDTSKGTYSADGLDCP